MTSLIMASSTNKSRNKMSQEELTAMDQDGGLQYDAVKLMYMLGSMQDDLALGIFDGRIDKQLDEFYDYFFEKDRERFDYGIEALLTTAIHRVRYKSAITNKILDFLERKEIKGIDFMDHYPPDIAYKLMKKGHIEKDGKYGKSLFWFYQTRNVEDEIAEYGCRKDSKEFLIKNDDVNGYMSRVNEGFREIKNKILETDFVNLELLTENRSGSGDSGRGPFKYFINKDCSDFQLALYYGAQQIVEYIIPKLGKSKEDHLLDPENFPYYIAGNILYEVDNKKIQAAFDKQPRGNGELPSDIQMLPVLLRSNNFYKFVYPFNIKFYDLEEKHPIDSDKSFKFEYLLNVCVKRCDYSVFRHFPE